MNLFIKKTKLLGLIALTLMAFSHQAQAERPSSHNMFQWLIGLGQIGFDGSGGMFLPGNVLMGLKQNRVSPFLQLMLMTHTMSSCTKEILKNKIDDKTPFQQVSHDFKNGLCKLGKCFQQSMLMTMLSDDTDQNRITPPTEEEKKAKQQQALMMMTAFGKNKCSGEGKGFDMALLALMMR